MALVAGPWTVANLGETRMSEVSGFGSFRVGCFRIPVIMEDLKTEFGFYDGVPSPRIRVDSSLGEFQTCLTVLHELLHAIDDQYAVGLTERQVRVLETGLAQVIMDNREGWEKITDGLFRGAPGVP